MQLDFLTLFLKSQRACLNMCVYFLCVDICACLYESACVCAHGMYVCAHGVYVCACMCIHVSLHLHLTVW